MKKLIAGLAVTIVALSSAASAQTAQQTYGAERYAKLPGYVGQVIADPDRTRDALEVANERSICKDSKVISARWRSDIVLAVRCPAGYAGAGAGAGLPGALAGTALTTGVAVGVIAVVTVLVVASGGDGEGTTTTTTTTGTP